MGEVYAGWIQTGQAGIIHGAAFGPTWLKGGNTKLGTVILRDLDLRRGMAPGQALGPRPITQEQFVTSVQEQAKVAARLAEHKNSAMKKGTHGPLVAGKHNLMVKNVVFMAKGKGALDSIAKFMTERPTVHIRAGVREGMEIEDYREDEHAPKGALDQYTRIATRDDLCRIPYYTYVDKWEKNDGLQSFLTSYVMPVVEFGLSTTIAGATAAAHEQWVKAAGHLESAIPGLDRAECAELIESLKEAVTGGLEAGHALKELFEKEKTGLLAVAASGRVKITMTCGERPGKIPLSVHEHSHPLPFFADELRNALNKLLGFSWF